ncbi:MAG TPA: carboxypeptidase-like regulatory domain-containing protein, partial [Dehalococcoidia bacterium]|nr:carboxypeptidase-like regulatory domain-containing protein [Dehalococcoidia bacterium]
MKRSLPHQSALAVVAALSMLSGAAAQVVFEPGLRVETPMLVQPAQVQPGRGGEPAQRVQQVPVGTAEIAGTVTRVDTGRPVRGALMTLSGNSDVPLAVRGRTAAGGVRGAGGGLGEAAGRSAAFAVEVPSSIQTPAGVFSTATLPLSRTALTDDQGNFVFDRLPSGRFTLSASRNQFLQTNYGQRAPGRSGRTIVLKEGQHLSLNVPLIRNGVISGVVLGEDGEPMAQASVRALQSVMSQGVRTLQTTGGATTDDRGMYRLTNLQPGDFIVYATPTPTDLMQADRLAEQRAAFEAAYRAAAGARAGAAPSVIAVSLPQPQQGVTTVPGFAPTYFPGTPMIG